MEYLSSDSSGIPDLDIKITDMLVDSFSFHKRYSKIKGSKNGIILKSEIIKKYIKFYINQNKAVNKYRGEISCWRKKSNSSQITKIVEIETNLDMAEKYNCQIIILLKTIHIS